MKQPEDPLSWWERSYTRKIVAISFLVALLLVSLALFPNFNEIYEKHSGLRNLLDGLTVGLGLLLAFFEFRHSGEANEHRTEHNRLTEVANKLRDENVKLHRETLGLQIRINELQEGIEKRLTKVRLYVRAHLIPDGLKLFISNLSEFDLWINQVELVVTEAEKAKPESRVIGGASRISRGQMEDGYKLYGNLVSINGDRTDRINMKFYVKVVVTGVADDPVTITSPDYQFTSEQGRTKELKTLKY